MTAYMEVNDEDIVVGATGSPDPEGFVGPPGPPPEPVEGIRYFRVNTLDFFRDRPSPTSVLRRYAEGAARWEEVAPIAELRNRAIQQIDAAGEALRLAVVNHMTMQTEEYRRVEAQARAWREEGYPEEEGGPSAPRGVRGWAMAKWRDGWTNRQAADDILATADGWMYILDEVRDLRLANKEDVRHAADAAEIAAISADMRADMRTLAQQINLTLTE